MYENFGHLQSEIVSSSVADQGPPYTDQQMWFAQYEQGPTGATAVVPIHMRNNPFMMANPTENQYNEVSPWKAPVTWFGNQSTGVKVGIIAGAAAVIGASIWAFTRK